jgi:hypothetical protein
LIYIVIVLVTIPCSLVSCFGGICCFYMQDTLRWTTWFHDPGNNLDLHCYKILESHVRKLLFFQCFKGKIHRHCIMYDVNLRVPIELVRDFPLFSL